MKILFVTTSTDLGGAEKALADLALFLKARHAVKVLSLKPLGEIARLLEANGIPVASLHMKGKNQFLIPSKIRAEIKQFQPDMVHAVLYRAIEFTRLACFGMRVKLITTPHYDLSKRCWPARIVDKWLGGLDTLSIAESFSTAQYLINHQKYPKNKVYLLPNGVDKTVFCVNKTVRDSMRKAYGFGPDNVVFISVARLEPVKNLILAVQSVRNVLRENPQARLVLVGEGSEKTLLDNFIRQNQLEKKVFVVGRQDNVADFLNMADVFVLPSREESLPLALLEALAVGLPCLVSKAGDMPLWVEHGKNGFVFPDNDITLCSCFMTELLDKKLCDKMSQHSLYKATLIGNNCTRQEKIYQQILSNSFHVKTK